MKWCFVKILVTLSLICPFVLAEDESGPFADTPLNNKLKGLDYEIENDREERIGIKEELQRQAVKQAEIRDSLLNNGPKKVAHIPSLTQLLSDLPGPLLQSIEKKQKEHHHETQTEVNLADVDPHASDISSASTTTSITSSQAASSELSPTNFLESTSKSSSFPSQIPPPPLEFSQAELTPVFNSPAFNNPISQQEEILSSNPSSSTSASVAYQEDSIPPPSFANPMPSVNTLPLPPLIPQLNSYDLDPSLLYQQQQQHFVRPLQQMQYSSQQQLPLLQQQLLQRQSPLNRLKQQQQRGIGPRLRLKKRPFDIRAASLNPLESPPMNFPPPLGYSSFIQTPMAPVSVINGIPLKMQSTDSSTTSNTQLLEAQGTYYNSHTTDSSLTKHDLAFSRRRRMNTHPEPILPDLPLPPVVAPV